MGTELRTGVKLNRSDLARLFGRSLGTIDRWVQRDCPYLEKAEKGRQWVFDSAAVIEWYADRWLGESSTADGVASLQAERARKTAVERRLAEIALQKKLGEVVEVEDVAEVVGDALTRVRAALLNVPSRIAALVAKERRPARVRQLLTEEIHAALRELSTPEGVVEEVTRDAD